MKITVYNGSPRGEKSNTEIMVEEFLEGAKSAGAEVENIFLAHKKIHHCLGCFDCWVKTQGKCVIKDDVSELLEKHINSDIVVFASPVYVGGVTGIMKNFIDRMLPLADPHFAKTKEGITCHLSRYEKGPAYVLISNCGFPEQIHFEYFRSVFSYLELIGNIKIIAEIYRGQGEMLKLDNPLVSAIIGNYKNLLRKAGKEVVENMCLSEQTKSELEKPLIPYELYVQLGNKHFDEILGQVAK